MAKEKEDLVPYYRPGTTEPEMVPKDSVPAPSNPSQAPAVMTPDYVAPEPEAEVEEEPKGAKKSAKKAAKKK